MIVSKRFIEKVQICINMPPPPSIHAIGDYVLLTFSYNKHRCLFVIGKSKKWELVRSFQEKT